MRLVLFVFLLFMVMARLVVVSDNEYVPSWVKEIRSSIPSLHGIEENERYKEGFYTTFYYKPIS